jgi:hypothetical protein
MGSDNNTSWYLYIKMIYLIFSPDNEHFVSSSSDHSVKAGWAMGILSRNVVDPHLDPDP